MIEAVKLGAAVSHLNAGAPWSGCSAKTLIELLCTGCDRNGDRPLLMFEDGVTIGRSEFMELTSSFAAYLRPLIKPGDRVAIAIGNRTEYLVALFAAMANRGILVSINPTAREHDAGYILRDSGPTVLITESGNGDLLARLAKSLPNPCLVVTLDGQEPRGLPAPARGSAPFDLRAAQCKRDDMIAIFYTSGTTGVPKGCLFNHERWLRSIDTDIRMVPGGRDRAFSTGPFFYADPALFLLMMLHSGGSLVVARRFSVSKYWDIVNRFEVTRVHAIASMPVLLAKSPPHPLERAHRVDHAICAAVPADLHATLVGRFGFPWLDNYGSTEAGTICRMPWHMHDEMIGSGAIGIPAPEVDLRIVDDGGRDLPPGQVGEALIRGPGLFSGYFRLPDATQEALRDGWFHSGDLVMRDERSFVYFKGRKKDVVRRSGENISAVEVETVLRQMPEIKDAAVVPVPDEIRGEEVKAYILLVDDINPSELPPEQIAAFCSSHLAPFKVPRFIEYRKNFPRTPSERVDKRQLKEEKPDLRADCWDRELPKSIVEGSSKL
ncbi:AMP-binding protein [Mesorhizobium sp. WSM3864]|uniref:class I adenylate-forming enzyme family protein n=1 Tax=Mesorhizobium sp. WSM3864 TaxID=2029404 RepID=UPI001482621E|nr:AMP-binding protein [Mesorhizobium sp. WSM3864]